MKFKLSIDVLKMIYPRLQSSNDRQDTFDYSMRENFNCKNKKSQRIYLNKLLALSTLLYCFETDIIFCEFNLLTKKKDENMRNNATSENKKWLKERDYNSINFFICENNQIN